MSKLIKIILLNIFYILIIPFLIIYTLIVKKQKTKIIWGPVPMISYKYWSKAMKVHGFDSITLVSGIYHIHDKKDFDLYFEDIVPRFFQFHTLVTRMVFGPLFSYMYTVKYTKLINISYMGGFLGNTPIWFFENFLYKLADIKVVVSGFGGDLYMYSKLLDQSLKHVLLMSYPKKAKEELLVRKKVDYWSKNADAIINGIQLDGIGRWSCLPVNMITIGNDKIQNYKNVKVNKIVTIVHSPNHRGFKGTEFIIKAIDELKEEGYRINFILLENIPNGKVLKILKEEADILVEQIIFSGYAMSGIEGMASSIPVLSNLSNETYTQLFRRYSYLNECPILSTTPENIKENIKLLIENKQLRDELGKLGIDYVKKYHSEEAAQYMYGKIYNQLLNDVDEDLINMFHPLKSEYNQKNYIKTPLVNNQYRENV
jgi:glycosyltransferase involved in cell wall biosynthesis